MSSSCTRGGLGWILGRKFFTQRVIRQWNRLSRAVTIPESVQKACSCRTWGHGLLEDLAVLGEQLDLMVLESSPTQMIL